MYGELPSTLCRIVLVTVATSFLVTGLVVYHRARDRVWNRLFAVHALSMGAWIFSNYLIQAAQTPAESGLWLRIAHPLAALVVCTFVDLAWVFPERIRPAPLRYRLVLYALGAGCGSLGLAPNLYKSLTLSNGFVVIEYGWPLGLFGLLIMVGLGYGDYLFLRKTFRLRGLQRVQVTYVFAGAVVGQAVAGTSIIIIPLVWHNTAASHWGAASYVLMVAAMAYSIAKHHIVRPQVALVRAAAYTATVGAVMAAVFGAAVLLRSMAPESDVAYLTACLLSGLAVGIGTVPLSLGLRERLERRLLLAHRHSPEAQQAETEAVLRNLRVEDVLKVVGDTIMHEFQPSHMCVMLRDPDSGDFVNRAARSGYPERETAPSLTRLPRRHILVRAVAGRRRLLDRDEVYRFASPREAYGISRAMDGLRLQIMAPLLWEGDLIGLVCLGEKRSGEIYEAAEMERIAQLMAPVSLALQNAESYTQMARMREFSENILRDMEGGVIAADAEGHVVLCNPAAVQILGLKAEEVVGQDLAVLPAGIRDRLEGALAGRDTRTAEQLTIERPDGRLVPVACAVSRLGGSPGSDQAGALALIHDLTLMRELEHEREEAARLSVIRVLAAGMAHEIRNPLVAIQTFTDLLPLRWDDPDFRETFMVTAQEEIQRIVGLVSELLMLSKPAGTVSEPVDIAELCQRVVRGLSAQAAARQICLTLELSPLTRRPRGDAGRLHQALHNLVGNALDAEPTGGEVHVTAEETSEANGAARVVLRVANPHSVIAPADLEEIFKPFYSRKQGGTGLGLAICETIVHEHRGTIEVTSSPERGTEFTVRLPLATQNGHGDPEARA